MSRATIFEVWRDLFPLTHQLEWGTLTYRLRVQARRMQQFGYEPFVMRYSPRELVLMAVFNHPKQYAIFMEEAYAQGDVKVREFIAKHHPEWAFEATNG